MSATTYDAERVAYLRSSRMEDWVAGYVREMVQWPGPQRRKEKAEDTGIERGE